MRALIMIAEGVEDSEFLYPYYRMQEEGIGVDVAGPEVGAVTGKHGYSAEVEMTFSQVNMSETEYDLLVLPGGKAPETVRLDEDAVDITRRMMEAGKVVAAICHGAQILISADVVDGKRATCWQGIRDDLKMAGAQFSDEEVVVDGNLITSRCPPDLPAFSREIFKALR